MRVMVYGDTPAAPTGFGTVLRNIFLPLVQGGYFRQENLCFFGINSTGEPHDLPFNVWPACIGLSPDRDPYGKLRFLDVVLNGKLPPFDVLFLLLDHFSLSVPVNLGQQWAQFAPAVIQLARQQPQRQPFKVIQYIPVDGEVVRPEWINWTAQHVDYPVAYTNFAKRVLLDVCPSLEPKLSVIYHGSNPEIFHPISSEQREQFRQQQLGLKPGDILISNISRNQPRKDVLRSIQMFKEVRRSIPQAKMYCHMNQSDGMGFDLGRVREQLQLPADTVRFPANFSEGVGLPLEVLNLVYNASDLVVTTARGEGFGLTVMESLTAGTPVLAPDHTSFSEILADGRGALVPPEPCRQVMLADNDQLRPVADVMAMAEKAVWLLRHPEERATMAAKGREWALGITWKDHIVPQWKAIFDKCDPKKQVTKPVRLAFNAGVRA